MQNKKLKRILTSFAVGTAAASAVIPVIACSEDGTITGGDIEKAIDQIKKELAGNKVEINDDGGISGLPKIIPDGTHWEYRVGDGEFSPDLPNPINPDDEIIIKLVSDEGAPPLPEEAEATVDVDEVITVDASTQDALNQIIITTENGGTAENLPNITNTHLEYSVAGEEYQSTLQSGLQAGTTVNVQLVANEGYELSDAVMALLVVKTDIVIDANFITQLDGASAVAGEGLLDLPAAPVNTVWQYALNNENFQDVVPDSEAFLEGDTVHVQLVATKNYNLSEPVEKDIKIGIPDFSVDKLQEDFAKTVIDVNGGISNLPTAPIGYLFYYSVNGEEWYPYQGTVPSDLTLGENVWFRVKPVSTASTKTVDFQAKVTVTTVIDTSKLADVVNNFEPVLVFNDESLPPAPAHAHWEFNLDNKGFSKLVPTAYEITQTTELAVRLVGDEDYYLLSNPVENDNILVNHFLVPNGTLEAQLALLEINASDEQLNVLPYGTPEHTHWQFEAIDTAGQKQTYTTFKPLQLFRAGMISIGEKIKVFLVADENYVLQRPIETEVTVQAGKIVDLEAPAIYPGMEYMTFAESLQEDLDRLLWFSYDHENIGWLPPLPEGAHWEYSMDGAEYSAESPHIGQEYYDGTKRLNMALRVVADEGRYLNGSFDWKIEATGIVNTEGYENKLDVAVTEGSSFPETPAHATLENSADTSPAWSVRDPNRRYHPYVYTLVPEEGWILSDQVMVGHD